MKKQFISPIVKIVEMRTNSILSTSQPSSETESLSQGTGTRPNIANVRSRSGIGTSNIEWD